MKNWLLLILFLFLNIVSYCQNGTADMADVMRSNGKIYVVVAVILVIFLGIVLYLVRLDRKITNLEKQQ